MKNVNQYVWTLLNHELSIQKDLSKGLVNVRALAKYLIDTYNIPASMDAVISAVRRFRIERVFEKEDSAIMDIIKGSKMSIKNNLSCVTLAIRPEEFFGIMCGKLKLGNGNKLITGIEQVKIIVEKDDVEQFSEQFQKKNIAKMEKDLSEITIAVKKIAIRTKGVLARISNELALHGINIVEIIVSPPEFLIYVKEKDALEAHKALANII